MPRWGQRYPCFLAAIFAALIMLGIYLGKLPVAIGILYGGASVLTFFTYALDKSAAKKGKRRTPENTLHLASLLGGWPGALVAQDLLRHKSQKMPFRAIFWGTVLLNLGALIAWALFESGSSG